MDTNPEIELARQYISQTGQNIFLTGRAGTGKTTFLRELKNARPKRMAVIAPTGVAAINAGGVTIHSFFQIAPGLYLPGIDRAEERRRHFRMSEQKKNILRTLDLLVIDEISMVRCDLLDAIDSILRTYRDHTKPFGGVQMLFFGDLQQLAPVARDEEWELLKEHYDTPFFFSANVMKQTAFITIELKKIYRQADSRFIEILSQIRTDTLTAQSRQLLNSRYIAGFQTPDDEEWIYLTTHNHSANAINQSKLRRLPGITRNYKAIVSGKFPETSYPADAVVSLKIGAQVMFIKNDTSPAREYYNGKIGRVTDMDDDTVTVVCKGEAHPIVVSPAEWTNTRYDLDPDTGNLREMCDGTFTQIPLRTAWAITIHKSQGLTFDHAVLDINHTFAHGQTYVALSRCRTLEGLVLTRPLSTGTIICDPGVRQYVDAALCNSEESPRQLPAFKRQYCVQLLNELFDFRPLSNALSRLLETAKRELQLSQEPFITPLQEAEQLFRTDMQAYSLRFATQYNALAAGSADCLDDTALNDRVRAAAHYFLGRICDRVQPLFNLLDNSSAATTAGKPFANAVKELISAVALKTATLKAAANQGMSVKDYLNAKASATLDLRPVKPDTKPVRKTKKTAEPKPRRQKEASAEVSLRMFIDGLCVAEIAEQRKLTPGSIIQHLTQAVRQGRLNINKVVPPDRRAIITDAIGTLGHEARLSEIKAVLPDDFEYAEIKAVLAYLNNRKTPTK